MVIGLYVHSKTNRHSAEAAPGWLHPLTCDHGVGGRMQHRACTWVCRGACWPLSSAYQLTHCATLIEIAADLQTMSTLSTASVFQVMHMLLKYFITHLHFKHYVLFASSGGLSVYLFHFLMSKACLTVELVPQYKVVHVFRQNHHQQADLSEITMQCWNTTADDERGINTMQGMASAH